MKKMLMMAAAAVFMMSCSGDDNESTNNPTPSENVVLVKKMIEVEAGETTTCTLTYDGNKLLKMAFSDGTNIEYTYVDGLLTKEETLEGTDLIEKFVYQYDSEKKLASSIELNFTDASGPEGTKTVYTYNNTTGIISTTVYGGDANSQTVLEGTGSIVISNGNITKHSFLAKGEATPTITTLTYDTKNDPFKNVFANDIMNLAKIQGGNNNVLSYRSSIEISPKFDYEYIYNTDNYPTTRTALWDGTLDYATQYFYE